MGNSYSSAQLLPAIVQAYSYVAGGVKCAVINALHHNDYDPKHIENAANRLNITLANIEGRTANMRLKIIGFTNKAIACRDKARGEALHFMKLKKMYEREAEKMMKIKFSIESNILQIESAGVLLDTVSALKETGGRIKGITRTVDLNKLEENIDHFFEYQENNNDLEALLSDSFSSEALTSVSDAELLEELDTMTEPIDVPHYAHSNIQDATPVRVNEEAIPTQTALSMNPLNVKELDQPVFPEAPINLEEHTKEEIIDIKKSKDQKELVQAF